MKKILLLIMSVIALQLNAQTITNYKTADGLLSNFVECIEADVNDNIWFGTSVGVQKFDGSNWTAYTTADGLVNDNVKVITSASNGDILVGTDFGASNFDGANWTTYDNTNGLNSNQVKSIDKDANGGIWIGTNLGVSYFDGTTWTSYSSSDLHWSGVNATAFDSNGDKWFASPLGGITHFDGTTFTPYDTSNGLLSQFVTALLIDDQDNKWVGTSSGMSVLDASNTSFTQHTRMYIMPPPDTLNPVVDVAMDSYGRIWTAIYVGYLAEGGIAYWDGNQWEDFHVSDGLVGPNVRGLSIDSEDNVWVATSTGVSKISFIPSSLNSVSNYNLEVFPNPSSGIITVSVDENLKNIEVYNVLGSLIHSEKIHFQNEISVNLSHLSSGIYHLVLRNENLVLNQKIIIE
jgi:ligand-binding sensor domain-containing protein